MAYSRRTGVREGGKRVPRHLRNEDIPRDTFTPRTYQVELFDTALHRNTMVCMSSASGRMFIAVMLMKEMSQSVRRPRSNGGKRSIYLASSDEMVLQKSPSILHPSDFIVGAYTEAKGVMDWSDEKWLEEIDRCEVLVMTGDIFLKLLVDNIIQLDDINILVLDDCHLILQDHPYKHIMQLYTQSQLENKPRILGLTSNILAGKYKSPEMLGDMISSLETALQSTAETSTLVIAERYGIKPTERVIECDDYEDTTGLRSELFSLLENAVDFLEECNIETSQDLDNRDPRLIPKAALIECHNILATLGPWCASCLADMLVNQIDKIEKQKEFVPLHKKFLKTASTTLRMLSKIFDNHFKECDYTVEDLLKYSTPKVTELINCLRKYRPETDFIIVSEDLENGMHDGMGSDSEMSDDSDFSDNNDDESESKSPSKQIHVAVKKVPTEGKKTGVDMFTVDEDKYLCGIVFVDHQHEAYALNKLIEEVCSWDENLCFVKSSHITAIKKKLYKKHEEILRKFRMQELNLLVSTNILEEGVDVPKCNLIVRFDVPRSYRSYSQSKGRARARDAEFVILIEEEHYDQFEAELKTYKQIEKVLIRQHNEIDEPSANGEAENNCDSVVEPYVPSKLESSVQVTLDTSIMLINRYCAKLPSDAFTHLTPTCHVRDVTLHGVRMYQASLRLPINSPIKVEIEGVPMTTKLKAKQAVALKMIGVLHKKGELDDNLMPIGKEMFQGEEEGEEIEDEDDDVMGEARPGTTKRKQYYCKKVAGALLQSHPTAECQCYVYVINMTLTGAITDDQNTRGRQIYAPEDSPRCFGILTSKTIPMVPMFPVFTRSGEVTVSVNVLSTDISLTDTQLDKLKTFHKFLFSNVLRLEKDPMDFDPRDSQMGYIVVPLTKEDKESPLEIDWQFTEKVVENSPLTTSKSKDPDELFVFSKKAYEDAVVMPSYRNIDQPQYFYVAEIRHDLNPQSPFPSPELYKTFAEYYTTKYGLSITNSDQPLLDVDHTSARLNLLIPRYMNQKGVPLPTSSAETKKARRENLQQKQILVPELCDIHVFLASLWRKAVCLPAILYRMNYLLLAEEIRKHVSTETKIGICELEDGFRFPRLDFGFDTSPENLKPLKDNKGTSDEQEVAADHDKGVDVETESSNEKATNETIKDSDSNGHVESEQPNISKCNSKTPGSKDGDESGDINDEYKYDVVDDKVNEKHDQNVETDKEEAIKDSGVTDNCDTDKQKAAKLSTFQDQDTTDDSKNAEMLCDFCSMVSRDIGNGEDVSLEITSCPKCSKLKQDKNKFMQFESATNENVQKAEMCNGFNTPGDVNVNIDVDCDFNDFSKMSLNDTNACKSKSAIGKCNNDLNNSIETDEDNMPNHKGDNDAIENDNWKTEEKQSAEDIKGWGDCVDIKENKEDEIETKYTDADNTNEIKSEDENDENGSNSESNNPEKETDVFQNVSKFVSETKKESDDDMDEYDNKFPETLISLDEDIDLSTYIGPSPCVILQALTMSNANDFFSLERLETIGDSFLKYAITVYLYCSYPGIHEGKLSYLRSKQVSNYNLYRLGKRKGLAECMISTKFEPYENWLAPGYVINEDKRKGPVPKVHVANMSRNSSAIFSSRSSTDSLYRMGETNGKILALSSLQNPELKNFDKDLEEIIQISKDEELEKGEKSSLNLNAYCLQLHHCLPDKSIADCVEALIGCYLTSCDKMAALKFMSWMGLKVLPRKEKSKDDEEMMNIEFERLPCPKSPFLSTTRDAESVMSHQLTGYEGFEAKIGYTFRDKAYLLQAFTHASYHYNTVTDCYQRLEFLGDAVLDYVITRHLYEDSCMYTPGVLTDLRSALVNNNIFAALAVKWDFHKYFKAISPALFHVIEKFVTRQKDTEDDIDIDHDEADDDQDKEHVELEVPKALGDIFESVAGAVYLDSGMSLDVVWGVFYRIMKTQIEKYLKSIPKSPVRELLEQEPETAKFDKPERTMDGKIRVTVNVVGKGVFTGVGRNYRIAKSAAAKKALRCIRTLEQQGLI